MVSLPARRLRHFQHKHSHTFAVDCQRFPDISSANGSSAPVAGLRLHSLIPFTAGKRISQSPPALNTRNRPAAFSTSGVWRCRT